VRRLIVTICPREPGVVVLPVEPGQRARRLDARGVREALERVVAARGLGGRVEFRDGCAGGCGADGPNVDVTLYPASAPGAPPDHVAVGWKTYVYSLPTLDCLARIIDENLDAPAPTRRRRRGR
jgi:hypothetical protein